MTSFKNINLASGAAHFKSPETAISRTIAALEKNETFYGEISGLPALKNAISKRYAKDYKIGIPAENILITSGTKQAIFNLFFKLLKPGDEVIIPKPSWFGFPEILDLLGVKTVNLETTIEDKYAIDPATLEGLITEKTRLFIFSNPGNPSGRLYSKTEISEWLAVLEKFPQVKVLSDEIYDLIVFDDAEMPCLLQFPDPQEKFIVVNGLSKNFAMSGWRIGYIIASPETIQKAAHFQHITISGVNPFIQEGAVAVLENKAEFLPLRLAELTRNREIICSWLDKNPIIKYFFPEGAYYVFADLNALLQNPKLQAKGVTSGPELWDYLKVHYNLEFQAGEKFNCPGFIRITFAVPEKDLTEALKRLELFLAELK